LIIETLTLLIGLAASTGSLFTGFDTLSSNPAETESASPSADAEPDPLVAPFVRPVPNTGPAAISAPESQRVNWTGILTQELRFLAIEHGFRVVTEAGTRDGGFGFGRSYWNSVFNLHGWADGDPFYVNYVGHPMNGAVAGYIWQQNDPRYRNVEFGKDPMYWKAKLRGAAFSWAQSEQFEIGPFSEASIGKVQSVYPQVGFVDHAVTPVMGLAWTLAEDALDKYLIKRVEDRTANHWIRMMARMGLNPSRTFANALALRVPWYRYTRAGIMSYMLEKNQVRTSGDENRYATPVSVRDTSTFEFALNARAERFVGANPGPVCLGGGASGAFRVAPEWMLVVDVGGCKFTGMETNLSGDSLNYLIGPRWTPAPAGRWSPYVQVLVGGNKITHEQFLPEKKRSLEMLAAQTGAPPPMHDDYTLSDESNAFAVQAGTGLDLKLSPALVLRVASLEYSRSYVASNRGVNYGSGIQLTTGMVLRVGTW
jgi:hypothetical protein